MNDINEEPEFSEDSKIVIIDLDKMAAEGKSSMPEMDAILQRLNDEMEIERARANSPIFEIKAPRELSFDLDELKNINRVFEPTSPYTYQKPRFKTRNRKSR